MRLLLGIILGAALTVGGAYVTDAVSGAEAKPMVNWDVVAKNVDHVTTLGARGLEADCRRAIAVLDPSHSSADTRDPASTDRLQRGGASRWCSAPAISRLPRCVPSSPR